MALDFSNKVILVTGSSSGIGEGIALLFAKLGGHVVVTGRNEAKIREVIAKCDQLSPNNSKAFGVAGDVCNDDDLRRVVNETLKRFGQIDVLVNNAGQFLGAKMNDPNLMTVFDAIISTNLRSVVFLCHLVIPHLVKTKGSIVNISSTGALQAFPTNTCYGAAKAALDMATKNMALELGPQGVRVNVVNPGAVETNIATRQGVSAERSAIIYEMFKNGTPLGVNGSPTDVAQVVAFLASGNAAFVTGANFVVDGGYLLSTPMSAATSSPKQ